MVQHVSGTSAAKVYCLSILQNCPAKLVCHKSQIHTTQHAASMCVPPLPRKAAVHTRCGFAHILAIRCRRNSMKPTWRHSVGQPLPSEPAWCKSWSGRRLSEVCLPFAASTQRQSERLCQCECWKRLGCQNGNLETQCRDTWGSPFRARRLPNASKERKSESRNEWSTWAANTAKQKV